MSTLTKFNRSVLVAGAVSIAALFATGCAVTRNQETTGAYIDDSTITTKVKSKFLADEKVGGLSIGVETLKGTVQLTGFAKSDAEKERAESIAREVKGVQSVKNDIVVRR